MRTFCKIIKYTLFCFFGLFLLFLAALFLFEQPVPDFLLRRITNSLSNADYLMRADSASFRFSRGLKINNPRLFDRRKPASRPVISAILPAFTGAPNSRMAFNTCSFISLLV